MLWSDRRFVAEQAAGTFAAEPWHPQDLTPNGLDLRIGQVVVPRLGPDAIVAGSISVPPGSRFLIGSEAVLRMPRDAAGSLWLRSSFARRGVLASFGKVDAGFAGNLTLAAYHAGEAPLALTVGERFCQLVLEGMDAPEADYGERGGSYQNQRGVTLPP